MIDIRYGRPTPTVPGKVSLPISAAYSGGLLFTIPVEIEEMGDAQKNVVRSIEIKAGTLLRIAERDLNDCR